MIYHKYAVYLGLFMLVCFDLPGVAQDDPLSIQFRPADQPAIRGGSLPGGSGDDDMPSPPPPLDPVEMPLAPRWEDDTPTTAPLPSAEEVPPPRPVPTEPTFEQQDTPITSPPAATIQSPWDGEPSSQQSSVIEMPAIEEEGQTPTSYRAGEIPVHVVAEYQPVGGDYGESWPADLTFQQGDRFRWRYATDRSWRVLEAYGPTVIRFFDHHYEIGGNFFHSFRDGAKRIQVPTLSEARVRRSRPVDIESGRENFRLFVAVSPQAPDAPPPDGNTVVWQKDKLYLKDLVAGEIDTLVTGNVVDHLELTSLISGVIYVLEPSSRVYVVGMELNFQQEIFSAIGREKGRADFEIQKLRNLQQLANTPSRLAWTNARLAYEQSESIKWARTSQMYEMFIQGQIDSRALIREGHPIPHTVMASLVYRHENLELRANLTTDYQGRCLVTANAMLWINESLATPRTPFALEVIDQSNPALFGYDTRYQSTGSDLVGMFRYKGATEWQALNVVTDYYYYVTFRPPQPGQPPVYKADISVEISGALSRLGHNTMVSAQLGQINLTPDKMTMELKPELLVSSSPMTETLRQIFVGPFQLEAWLFGRRSAIYDLFARIPVLPEESVQVFDELVDEAVLKIQTTSEVLRVQLPGYEFKPVSAKLEMTRTTTPGTLRLTMVVVDQMGNQVQVVRDIQPYYDLLTLAAASVATNRDRANLQEFEPLSLSEWLSMNK